MRLPQTTVGVLGFLLIAVAAQFGRANGAEPADQTLAAHLPQGAIATLEFTKLAPLIGRIETSAGLQAILASPQWRDALNRDPVQKAMAGKVLIENQLGMSLWDFAKIYLGDRTILGIYPPSQGGSQPDAVAIVRVKDAESLERLWVRLVPLLPLVGSQLKVGNHEGGGHLITVADGHQILIRDRWIVLSKVKSLFDGTIQKLSETSASEGGLSETPAWKSLSRQLGSDHEVQFCLDMAGLNAIAGHRVIPAKLDNGLLSLLLGGYLELAASSPYIGSTIDVGANHFEWRTTASGDARHLDAVHRPFVLEGDSIPQATTPRLDNTLNGFSLTRDFAGWYRNREALLDAKLLPAFDKFETGLATFLSGRDFADDVLPTFGHRLTIVTAPQSFDHLKGKPGLQLPGIAVLLDLAKPAEAKDLLNLVFQTVILVSNLQAAQEGRQPFVLSSESYHDVQIAYAKYLKPPEGETLPISANFQPASARVGNRFVIATNVAMCRQLIDSLLAEVAAIDPSPAGAIGRADSIRDVYFDISPTVAADLLEKNATFLHSQSLQQGKSNEQSVAELDALVKLLRQLMPLTFASTRSADRWELEFRGGWK